MPVPAWLPRAALAHPDRIAVETPDESLSYGDLLAHAQDAAAFIASAGGRAGDTAALRALPDVDFAIGLHAVLLLGGAVMPIDPRLGEAERLRREREADLDLDMGVEPVAGAWPGSRGMGVGFFGRPRDESPRALPPPEHDLAAVALHMFTSGTTAAPRAVRLTYGNVLWSALGSALALGLDAEERWLCPMPVAHVGGVSILLRSAIYGTTALLHERFDVERVLAVLRERPITVISLVPTMLARLLDAGLRSPPHLRHALIGGAPAPPELLARAAEAGVPAIATYGMTEASSQVATGGLPLPFVSVELGGDGEILVGGPTVAPPARDADGLLHTGDLGGWDEHGRLVVIGRKTDTIVSGAENIAPQEVEAILLAHPDVSDAAVFGRPDAEWGEAVHARVVPRDGAEIDPEALRAHVAYRLARFKVPKTIEVVAELPRTASGKLLRREL